MKVSIFSENSKMTHFGEKYSLGSSKNPQYTQKKLLSNFYRPFEGVLDNPFLKLWVLRSRRL